MELAFQKQNPPASSNTSNHVNGAVRERKATSV